MQHSIDAIALQNTQQLIEAMPVVSAQDASAVNINEQGLIYFNVDNYHYKLQKMDYKDDKGINVFETILAKYDATYMKWCNQFIQYLNNFDKIQFEGDPEDIYPFWNNNWFPPLDGIALYTFIATQKPELYIELGSGNSTKFARQAIKDHNLSTKIISIDPFPRANIDEICDEVIRAPLESVDTKLFKQLKKMIYCLLTVAIEHYKILMLFISSLRSFLLYRRE